MATANRTRFWDSLFLVAVVALTSVPYIAGLGFYSDDHAFFMVMVQAEPQTPSNIFAHLISHPETRYTASRPVQAAYFTILYKLFGDSPLPGHVFNHVVFTAGLIVVYRCLRNLRVERFLSLSAVLIFGCLPHFSTDRFWFSAYQANLSLLFFGGALYCSIEYARGQLAEKWPWLIAACLAVLISLMAYEIFVGLHLLVPCAVWFGRVFRPGWPPRLNPARDGWLPAFLTQVLLFTAIIVAVTLFKWTHIEERLWSGTFDDWVAGVIWLLKGVVRLTFLEQGLKLPLNLANLLAGHLRTPAVIVALISFAAIFAYLYQTPRDFSSDRRFVKAAIWGGFGMLIFLAGYVAFVNNFQIGFSPTGIANRVTLASALGTACIALSVVLLSESLVPETVLRWFGPGLISLGCASGILINATLGILWTEAAQTQRAILAQLGSDIPEIEGPKTVLLDGFCPFVGPGPVFESFWDLKGALQILYDNPSLNADIIKPTIEISDRGITTTLYGKLIRRYRYGDLIVYNLRERYVANLNDREAAKDYFAKFDPKDSSGCRFEDGGGVSVY